MKTLDIVKNEKALRKGAEPNDSDSYNLSVGRTLKEQVIRHNGYGLSSPQVGVTDAKVCVINVKEPIVLVNPRIVESSGSAEFTEGCLSFPGKTVRTQRHTEVVVEADNFQGRLWFSASDPDNPDENDPDFIECVAAQHECLPSRSLIKTREGYVTIGEIVRNESNCEVETLNTGTGEKEFKRVVGWKKSGNGPKSNRSKKWVKLSYKDSNYSPLKNLICTADHPIGLVDDLFPVEASDIKFVKAGKCKGKYAIRRVTNTDSNNEGALFNRDQSSVLFGTLLGDGSIDRGILYMNHGQHQKEYCSWKADVLGGRVDKKMGIGFDPETPNWCGVVNSNAQILELENLAYVKGYKSLEFLPVEKLLNPLSLAVLYQDDGCIQNHRNLEVARIHIESFTFSDAEILVEVLLNKFDIKAGVHERKLNSGKIAPLLYLHKSTIDRFWNLISPYVHESMRYKLPESYRNSGFAEVNCQKLDFAARKIRRIDSKNMESYLYDIEVEGNHNFYAQDTLVHNCDHLNGVLMFDREAKGETYVKSGLDTLGRNDKVKVKTQGGDVFKIKWKKAKKKVETGNWKVLETCDE